MPIPHRSTWKVHSATGNTPESAIDGDYVSAWSGPEGEHSLTVDLGVIETVGGVALHWGRSFGFRFAIRTSVDGNHWEPAFETAVGEGRFDLLSFRERPARWVRLDLLETAGHQGFQLVEIVVLDPAQAPATSAAGHAAALDGELETAAAIQPGESLLVDLRELREVQGLRLDWGTTWATRYGLYLSEDGATWIEVGRIDAGVGEFDSFYHLPRSARFLKISVDAASDPRGAEVRRLKFRLNDKALRPLGALERAAARAPRGLYPAWLLREQVYWTLVGTAAMREESLLDEYGMLEIRAGKPSVLPLIRVGSQLFGAAGASEVEHFLAEGSLPVPSLAWRADRLEVRHDAVASDGAEYALAYRISVTNSSTEAVEGAVLLTVRPVQVNPEWQHGGISPIHALEIEPDGTTLLDGQVFLVTQSRPARAGVTEFDEGDVARLLERGEFPSLPGMFSRSGLLSGALEFPFELGPGETAAVEVRAPLRDGRATETFAEPFAARRDRAVEAWQEKLGPQRLQVNDALLTQTLRSQIGYTLVNQNGLALQPGSRNYDRTWMRDGAAHAVALMQAGLAEDAKAYLHWYSQAILPNGLVPPILNPDGSINTGHGSNLEYDAQGQFIWAVAEAYRLTRDQDFIQDLYPKVKLAMQFMVELRQRTLDAHPEGSRFHGILAPSISHEGYGKPTHSYWDDFFALKGWADGADLARLLGDHATVRWAEAEREKLFASLSHAIRQTISDFGLDYIPSSSDLGDFDPTSTSISFLPCECAEVLPAELLEPTYRRYLRDVRERYEPGWPGRFTPYDLRNINAFVGRGKDEIAHELLDYLMTCRRPAGWNHWAEVIIGDARMADYIGDMPHTWIGAELCAAVRRMVVHEQGDVLHLLPAVKPAWLEGSGIQLEGLPTHFGALWLTARGSATDLKLDWSLSGEGFPAPSRVSVLGQT